MAGPRRSTTRTSCLAGSRQPFWAARFVAASSATIEIDNALIDQSQHCVGKDGFAETRGFEDGVAGHRLSRLDTLDAESVRPDDFTVTYQSYGQARHIAVHSRAVLEALRKLYDAGPLVKELGGE